MSIERARRHKSFHGLVVFLPGLLCGVPYANGIGTLGSLVVTTLMLTAACRALRTTARVEMLASLGPRRRPTFRSDPGPVSAGPSRLGTL